MNKYFLFIFLLVSVLSWESCTRKTTPVAAVDTTDLTELNKFHWNELKFTTFSFKAKVIYKDAKDEQQLMVTGRMKKDSIIWLSISPGLGLEAVRCVILKDSIFILDRIHNDLITYDFDFLNRSFNTSITFQHLQDLIMGNLPYKKSRQDKLVKNEEAMQYVLRQYRNSMKIDNSVSFSLLRLDLLEVYNELNASSVSVRYNNFVPLDSFMMASEMVTSFRTMSKDSIEDYKEIKLTFLKTELDKKDVNYPFVVPKRLNEKEKNK